MQTTDLFDRPVNLFHERLALKQKFNRQPAADNPNYQIRYSNALMQFCDGAARRVVDVGANKGIMTDRYRQWADHIESFEPLPALCRPQWHNVALSNTTGVMPFFACDDPAMSRLQLTPTTQANGTIINVPVRPLDSFGWTDVGAIKVDVEGFELEVLQGALYTIRASHPVIQVELMKQSRMLKKNQQVVEMLVAEGYTAFDSKHLPLGREWFHRPKDSDWFFKRVRA